MTVEGETGIRQHFRFGENWRSFLSTMNPDRIAEAERGLKRLFPDVDLTHCRFLDIGCGSGLSMLAAHRLGATVQGIDLDPDSIGTTRILLGKYTSAHDWSVAEKSVFDLNPERDGRYDIVYSWGALHHTGSMWIALERAAAMVAPHGRLAVALYRRTPLCTLWRLEKRFYARAPTSVQAAVRVFYKGCYLAALMATGRSPRRYLANYKSARGMDWSHDVHDWLGGYPYESTEPTAVVIFLKRLGLSVEHIFEHQAAANGLFGTHCDEYVAIRD